MRNGKTLLRWMVVMVVVAVASTGFVLTSQEAQAAGQALEPTESGAPSAMVLFPVTEKANPAKAAMRPVVFNHLVHEKKISDCETCHHTGDPTSCASCHTVEGKAEGNFITLERAMHAENIAKRANGKTPSSCVSCHNENLKRRECAGCHAIVTPKRDEAYCAACHNVTPKMTDEEMQQGMQGKLASDEALATETVLGKKPVNRIAPQAIPYKVQIDGLKDDYEGCSFTHARHVASLMKRMENDKLADAFHSSPETLCQACHHRSPLSATPPKCSSCHKAAIDPAHPERPNLKAAYHLQCMGCHNAMKVARPQNQDCTTCHKERAK
ncbi:MAG: cytochrome c3 family protein [Desulfovibrionaceae bacterium]|nr:cytochrome c3 family protein [Desulfovibrionaceae bacterium]